MENSRKNKEVGSFLILFFLLSIYFNRADAQTLQLTPSGYFQASGVNVMAFDDIYPEGHQGGVSLIMNGDRIATNGDIRLEATPGQWQPVPKQLHREVDSVTNTITTHLMYPDSSRHLTGFNPMIYPDLVINYSVTVKGVDGAVIIKVDLDKPIPEEFLGKVGFNLELFPGALFGKSWIMDHQSGIFPRQPNGPTQKTLPNDRLPGKFNPQGEASLKHLIGKGYSPIVADDIIAKPYAIGKELTVSPDDSYHRFTIKTEGTELKLYDGRMNHNNGWFVVRSEVSRGKTTNAIKWVITPNIVKNWRYKPVVQTSQVGYEPSQPKTAIVELDKREKKRAIPALYKITPDGEEKVLEKKATEWGHFLRYNYLKFDFSDIEKCGLYKIRYGKSESSVFRIAEDVYDRGIWQPVLEYFLPIQMCHMRVNEKYRVWHGLCHMDDAKMAPVNYNHFDGYVQGPSTFTSYKGDDKVPGLNIGGWHDAGDYDLRVESQAGEAYILALAYESFGIDYDVTSVDQIHHVTEIHQPDGKPDILQQVENGTLNVIAGYRSLGRLFRGVISNNLRQYVLLGDGTNMTDNIPGNEDDRWVFTEENPARELTIAAYMAAAARVLSGFNDTLSAQALDCAQNLFRITKGQSDRVTTARVHAATELYLATGDEAYGHYLLKEMSWIKKHIKYVGWFIGRAEKKLNNANFTKSIREGLQGLQLVLEKEATETPYGIPYQPYIWGAGWDIQSFGFKHYFLYKSYPDIFSPDYIFNALNFVLGCHPGSNTSSFASGVGTRSVTVAYGFNRADWSYIPGGVVSGTALIRPDFPELLKFPYLWQQTEYVMGGGSSHYMFLVLAARQILSEKQAF